MPGSNLSSAILDSTAIAFASEMIQQCAFLCTVLKLSSLG
jgi:hypothetical protein